MILLTQPEALLFVRAIELGLIIMFIFSAIWDYKYNK